MVLPCPIWSTPRQARVTHHIKTQDTHAHTSASASAPPPCAKTPRQDAAPSAPSTSLHPHPATEPGYPSTETWYPSTDPGFPSSSRRLSPFDRAFMAEPATVD
eukprot:6431025-Pyramimonas_sp.AAC.1